MEGCKSSPFLQTPPITPLIVIIKRKHLFHGNVWNSNFWASRLLISKGCLQGQRKVTSQSYTVAAMKSKGRSMLNYQTILHVTTLL